VQLHIGLDDTDSRSGGCTTYLAARLVEKLTKLELHFTDYPNIIRLNPNIPYKTRGNAAVVLRLKVDDALYCTVREMVLDEIEQESKMGEEGTDPAVIFLLGKPGASIRKIARRALSEIVPVRDAVRNITHENAEAVTFGSNVGLVGALAAIGNTIEGDHTYELIAYRNRENCGTPRRVDKDSVIRMNSLTAPLTFNNYDEVSKRLLITPHGPDPVLVGIRGESPESVRKGFNLLKIHEPVERWVIFRTNHATDDHLEAARPGKVKPNCPVVLPGKVIERPKRLLGGHALFTLQAEHGRYICAAFEPTGNFRDIVDELHPGDQITAFGGTSGKHGLTVNLEKLWVRRLTDVLSSRNPRCPTCGKSLKSAGREKGFKCARCLMVAPHAKKRRKREERPLKPGIYLPALKAHRHLTKPLCRYGRERVWNNEPPSDVWHSP
jgi:tRNA(Ile2)-agmatinylcytidine synthase